MWRIIGLITITILSALLWIVTFIFGYTTGKTVQYHQIVTDSLTTHCGKYTIDLPYRLDTSHEDMLARRVGDTIYIYHRPKQATCGDCQPNN